MDFSLSANPSKVAPGDTISLVWSGSSDRPDPDWIALVPVGAPNTDYSQGWWLTHEGAISGSLDVFAHLDEGEYEFRYLLPTQRGGYSNVVRSNVVTVETGAGAGTGAGTGPSGLGLPSNLVLAAGDRTAGTGGTVQIPITLEGTQPVGNINLTLTYDPQVAQVEVNVLRGGLIGGVLFQANRNVSGEIKFGFATTGRISPGGSVAVVEFRAVGQEGSSTSLALTDIQVNDVDGNLLNVRTRSGRLTIQPSFLGDGDGDGRTTEVDALMALQMSVGLRPEDLVLDADGDGNVTSNDARILLQQAVGGAVIIATTIPGIESVQSFSAKQIIAGSAVMIIGENFASNFDLNLVLFGDKSVAVLESSNTPTATEIQVIVPPISGPTTVTVTNLSTGFTSASLELDVAPFEVRANPGSFIATLDMAEEMLNLATSRSDGRDTFGAEWDAILQELNDATADLAESRAAFAELEPKGRDLLDGIVGSTGIPGLIRQNLDEVRAAVSPTAGYPNARASVMLSPIALNDSSIFHKIGTGIYYTGTAVAAGGATCATTLGALAKTSAETTIVVPLIAPITLPAAEVMVKAAAVCTLVAIGGGAVALLGKGIQSVTQGPANIVITRFRPEKAAAGDEVLIEGTGFDIPFFPPERLRYQFVELQGILPGRSSSKEPKRATATYISPTRVSFTVPSGFTCGLVNVRLGIRVPPDPTDWSPSYSYRIRPILETIRPSSGKAGDHISIDGTGLAGCPATLTFGTDRSQVERQVGGIFLEVPSGQAEGTVDVFVEVDGVKSNIIKFNIEAGLHVCKWPGFHDSPRPPGVQAPLPAPIFGSLAASPCNITVDELIRQLTPPPDHWAVYKAGSIGLFVDVSDQQVVGAKETCRLAYGGLCGSGITLAQYGFTQVKGPFPTRDGAMAAICSEVSDIRYVLGVTWGTYQGEGFAVGNLRC